MFVLNILYFDQSFYSSGVKPVRKEKSKRQSPVDSTPKVAADFVSQPVHPQCLVDLIG